MKILHYASIGRNPSSGVSVIVPKILNAQSSVDNVALYNYGSDCFDLNDDVVYIDSETLKDDYHFFPYGFNKPDVVVFHSPFGFPACVRIVRLLVKEGIPYVIVPHGCFAKLAMHKKFLKKMIACNTIYRYMLHKATAIQYLSEGERCNSVFSYDSFILSNGIDIPILKQVVNHDNLNITYIGRKDVYNKGIDLVIEAASLVYARTKNDDIKICIYGPEEADSILTVADLINKYDVKKIVNEFGPVYGIEKENVLSKTDVLILTSRSEGLPTIVLEAWAMGIPTILSYETNMSDEAVLHNCGWKVDLDCKSIADLILEISKNKDEIRCFSENCRKHIYTNYDWSMIASKYHEVYKRIVE